MTATSLDPRLLQIVTAGALGAGAIHELRNNLAIVASSLYLARRDYGEEALLLSHLEKATSELQRAQTAAEMILSLAQGEALTLEPCLASSLLATARGLISLPSSFLFHESIEPEDLSLFCHPILFPQVLSNLYLNSMEVQRGQPQGSLRVSVSRQREGVEIRVEDNGPGIPKEKLEEIFTPLVTDKVFGTGLGLVVARAIVEAHGGSLTALPSERGACFRILVQG